MSVTLDASRSPGPRALSMDTMGVFGNYCCGILRSVCRAHGVYNEVGIARHTF